jgi:hypothetical protein
MKGVDLGRLSPSERALMTKLKDYPTAQESAAFNAVAFHKELVAAAKQLGVKTMPALAKDTGVRPQAIAMMRRGIAPSLATFLQLCDWAGLDPMRFLVQIAPAAANDAEAQVAA